MPFGAKVCGFPADDLHPAGAECGELVRIVGQQADAADTQCPQHAGCDQEVALVSVPAQRAVGVQRIQPPILQRIGTELVDQPDASTLLCQIKQDAGPLGGHAADRSTQLLAAIAAQAAEQIAGEALGMDADQRGGNLLRFADDDGKMIEPGAFAAEGDYARVWRVFQGHEGGGDLTQPPRGGTGIFDHVERRQHQQTPAFQLRFQPRAQRGNEHRRQQQGELAERQGRIGQRRRRNRIAQPVRRNRGKAGIGDRAQGIGLQQVLGHPNRHRGAPLRNRAAQHRGCPCRRQQQQRRIDGERHQFRHAIRRHRLGRKHGHHCSVGL